MLICTNSSQFHCPELACRGLWVEVNGPLSAEHPVRQTIVPHSVYVWVCVSVFGVGLGALPGLRENFFYSTTYRLPAGIADRSKTLNLRQIKGRKENVGTKLVKRGRKTNTFSWTLEGEIHSKHTKCLKWKSNCEYFQRNHISVFMIYVSGYICLQTEIYFNPSRCSPSKWKECIRQLLYIFTR